MTDHPTLGEFILGFEGLGIMRSWTLDPAGVKARVRSVVEMAGRLDEEPGRVPPPWGRRRSRTATPSGPRSMTHRATR